MLESLAVRAIPVDPKCVHPPPPHEQLLEHPFTLGFSAAKGAGKTTTIVRLLEFYAGYFHRIFICAPTVKNDPKWSYIMNKPGIVKRHTKLEKFLAKHNPELLKKRDILFGDDSKDSGYKVETLGSKSKRKRIEPTIVGDGRRRFLRTEEGVFLNKNENTCVMVRPLVEEKRRPIYGVLEGNRSSFEDLQDHSTQWYRERMDSLYPTLPHKTATYSTIRDDPDENKETPELENSLFPNGKLTDKCVFAEDAPAKLQMIMDIQDEIILALEKDKKTIFDSDRVLIIFDDMVGSDLFSKAKDSQAFTILQARHRHFNLSQVIVVQAYKAVSKTARVNLSGLILFRVHNQKELDVVYEENPCFLARPEWDQVYEWATDEKHSFLFINYQLQENIMWKCFEEAAPSLRRRKQPLLSTEDPLCHHLPKPLTEEANQLQH